MDRLGFSLCSVPLDIVGSCISNSMVKTTAGRMEVQCIVEQRESEGLSEQEVCT